MRFGVSPHHYWTYRSLTPGAKRIGQVMVDTDWDGTPDTVMPGTSNFAAGNRNKSELCPAQFSADGGCAHGITEPGPLPTAEAQ